MRLPTDRDVATEDLFSCPPAPVFSGGVEVAASTPCAASTGLTAGRPHFPGGTTLSGTSQGSACPDEATPYSTHTLGESRANRSGEPTPPTLDSSNAEFLNAVEAAKANIELVKRINADSNQSGRTWSIPVSPEMQSRTPVWSGRAKWQHQVREIVNAPEGINLCREHHIDPERVYAVAVTMARSADHRTGRRVTASRDVLAERAGVSVTVLKRARRVLSTLGMAQEMVRGRLLRTVERWAAEAHHGRRQTKATSVWALVSPKSAATCDTTHQIHDSTNNRRPGHPQPAHRGPQSLSTCFSSCTSVRKYKTTRAQARDARKGAPQKQEPRPLALQRAAGELLAHAPALKGPRHTGAVCDAIRSHSVDVTRWTGRDIARALSEDTKRRGWTWPDSGTLHDPIAFLRWRLARIDWSGPSYSEQALSAKKHRDQERTHASQESARQLAQKASDVCRRRAMSRIRAILGSA